MFVEDVPLMPTTVTADVARNRVKIALYDLYLKHKASLAKVRVQEKPTKLVLCKNAVKEGEIKLVAMTTTITTVKQGSRVNQNDVHLGVLYEDPKEGPMVGYLSPSKTIWPSDLRETMVVPYWLVRTTPNEDEANMEHCSISVGSKEFPFRSAHAPEYQSDHSRRRIVGVQARPGGQTR